jgi:hypothetical protein
MLGIRGGDAYGIYNLLCGFAPETTGLSDWQLREVCRGGGREQEAATRIWQEGLVTGEI